MVELAEALVIPLPIFNNRNRPTFTHPSKRNNRSTMIQVTGQMSTLPPANPLSAIIRPLLIATMLNLHTAAAAIRLLNYINRSIKVAPTLCRRRRRSLTVVIKFTGH